MNLRMRRSTRSGCEIELYLGLIIHQEKHTTAGIEDVEDLRGQRESTLVQYLSQHLGLTTKALMVCGAKKI